MVATASEIGHNLHFNKLIMNRVKLNTKSDEPEYVGTVVSLHLPADLDKFRKYDLWNVNWDNGKKGIIEKKDIKILS